VVDGRTISCPQAPTTLPTMDEMLGRDGCDEGNIARRLLALSESPPPTGHVYTLHAELEGGRLLPAFEALLAGWRSQGYQTVTLSDLLQGVDRATLPRHRVVFGRVPGRSGTLLIQAEGTA
jgi:peptidoglycan/xylan/chitin deacetylase (PgdA/CDA1 family)